MAKKYEDFDYQDYVSKRQPQLDTLYNQYTNFDSVYDPSKDTGLQTAKNQLMSEANVLASKERGRMGNRIGARSSWTDAISSSIQTDALKNYQNLIPQYMQNAKNDLLNQYNMLNQLEQQDYSRWADKRNFDYQNYANSITQENADRAYNYQVEQDKEANRIALAQAEAAKQQAINAAAQQAWEQQYKYDSLNAQYGTNYTSPSGTQNGNASGTGSNSGNAAISRTGNTDSFQKIAWSRNNFEKNSSFKNKFGTYENYISYLIQDALNRGRLNNSEAKYLYYAYGIN